MPTVRLVSWDEDDARRRSKELEQAGLRVNHEPLKHSGLVAQFKDIAAVCIDLDRLPSHGREIAVAIRQVKGLRHIPIVFAGGAKEKVFRIRKELPDAFYAEWAEAPKVLRMAMRVAPVSHPVQPPAHMERFAGSSLVKKLGIAAGSVVSLLGAPEDFMELLGDLPEGVEFENAITPRSKMAIWFARSRAELERELEFITVRLPQGAALWIAYPKQAGSKSADLTQAGVREVALAAGLVDYKVCAIDADWSRAEVRAQEVARKAAVRRWHQSAVTAPSPVTARKVVQKRAMALS